MTRIFVDTNVLIRANVLTAPLHSEARSLLQHLVADDSELWISRQVLREYIMNVTRPQTYAKPVDIAVVQQQVRSFENLFHVADETAEVTRQLLILLAEIAAGGKQVHDANIIATMIVHDIESIVTNNVDDMRRFAAKVNIIPLE